MADRAQASRAHKSGGADQVIERAPVATLYRPVGPAELKLIEDSGWKRFPPRLPEQAIVYPVLTLEYADQITRQRNVPQFGAGYVAEFDVDRAYVGQFEIKQVGARDHSELWVPAEELDRFNSHIRGSIRVVRGYPRAATSYEAVAAQLIRGRDQSNVGVATVGEWAKLLPVGGSILDLGCGHGVPIAAALMKDGFEVYGIDAAPSLVSEFRRRFPRTSVACEAAEDSSFFQGTFDGIIAIGLIFLLPVGAQRELIQRIASALQPSGRFLFTAPTQRATWRDILTGRLSLSLGAEEYGMLLSEAGLCLEAEYVDDGGNHYYSCISVKD